MKLEIGPVACECPHCGTTNQAQLEVDEFRRSYVVQCHECSCEFLLREINVVAAIAPGACAMNVTARTAKECR